MLAETNIRYTMQTLVQEGQGEDSTIEAIEYNEAFCKQMLEKTKLFYETMLKPLGC